MRGGSAVALVSSSAYGDEAEGRRVDAVAEAARGGRAVAEDVAEVAAGAPRPHLGAPAEVRLGAGLDDVSASIGRVKLGQPVRLSNLSVEANSGSPETTST